MADFKIISDSSCDLNTKLLLDHDIDLVPYLITFDGVNYLKEGIDINSKELYRRMRGRNVFPKTSLPPIQDYIDKFRIYMEQGMDVICICLTSKFSGSYQSAINSAAMLMEEFPERKIRVIDSWNVTLFQGFLVLDVADMKKQGKSMDEICDFVETYKEDNGIVLTVDTLDYLQKGGRIGKATALAGSLFNIKPIITFDDGELQPNSKVRGRKKALHEVAEILEKRIGHKKNDYRLGVVNSDCVEDALLMTADLTQRGYNVICDTQDIGVTITVHAGPGTVGVGYLKNI